MAGFEALFARINHGSRRLWRRGLLLLLVFVSAIAFTGCDPSQLTKADTTSSRIVFNILGDPKTFNPTLSQEYPNVFLFTVEGMISTDGETGEIIPWLAESWDISDDGLTYTFTLREGLQWSDGEPLTATDVFFTFHDVIFNEAIPAPSRDVFRIGPEGLLPEIEQLDERRVRFTLPESFAPFLLYAGSGLLPAHALKNSVDTVDADGNPLFLSTWTTGTPVEELVSNGPYRLKEYVPGQRVVFEKNPYYWYQDELGDQLPYVEELVGQVIESRDNELLQFRSGGLDTVEKISTKNFPLLKREAERGDFTIYNGGPNLGTLFMSFNLNKASRNGQPLVDPIKSAWFNSVNFRRAVSYAIDRPTMVNNVYQGLGDPQTSPIAVQSPYYAGPEDGIPTYEYNLEKARSLLEEDGFQFAADGRLLDAEGNRVRFTLITNAGNVEREASGAQIKQDLSKIGIQVDFQPISFNALVTKLGDSLDWEAHIIGFTASLEPHGGSTIWRLDGSLHSFNQQALPGQEPLEGWEAADWEKQIADIYVRAAQVIDEQERFELYKESQRLTQEYLPYIYLVNPLNFGAVRNTIKNVNYSGISRPFALWNVTELQVER
ncbi:MAG: ABC transporter substrate-binding protein [Cyanobacteria bacterium P01_D01_bin.71]